MRVRDELLHNGRETHIRGVGSVDGRGIRSRVVERLFVLG